MGDNPIALSRHGPIGYIPTTGWRAHLSCGIFGAEFESLIEQKNPCVRSQLARLSYRAGSASNYGVNVEITAENVGYLYPPAFRVLMEQARMHDEEQGQGNTINDIVPEQHHPIRHATVYQKRFEWLIGIKNRLFGIYCTSAVEVDSQEQPTYVVLGIFARGYSDPMERIVFVDKPKQLFRNLRWTAFRLRGLRGTVLSLKHVKGFMLYKCDVDTGTHERIHLDQNGNKDLQLLMSTYKSWHVPDYIALDWADWIHHALNNSSLDVLDGGYALELVLDWSLIRISVVVLLPVLLSLAIGLWLNSSSWTDLATIQTAWGTASYIVTAGALLAALLGFLDLSDK